MENLLQDICVSAIKAQFQINSKFCKVYNTQIYSLNKVCFSYVEKQDNFILFLDYQYGVDKIKHFFQYVVTLICKARYVKLKR